jgi:hypothetical protein
MRTITYRWYCSLKLSDASREVSRFMDDVEEFAPHSGTYNGAWANDLLDGPMEEPARCSACAVPFLEDEAIIVGLALDLCLECARARWCPNLPIPTLLLEED